MHRCTRLLRFGIRRLLRSRLDEIAAPSPEAQHERLKAYLQRLRAEDKVALATAEANEQHYEVPTEFFHLSLGSRKKYSCCVWPDGCQSLEEAEERCLETYAERAKLADGQDVLDLGCGFVT